MRLTSLATAFAILLGTGCALDEQLDGEELGDIGDGKSDSFGIEPTLAMDQSEPGSYSLTIKNVGDKPLVALLNVRPLGGFGALPNPNAAQFPDASWQPPAIESWPASYVIFNNTGCGHDCTQADQTALGPRSVMIKMLSTAIRNVKENGTIRISNFNISGSSAAKPVVDAVLWAIQNKHATVKIVMDEGQNTATSRTTLLASQGAQVRFLNGMSYTTSTGNASVGIMHSKIVVVDDAVVFTGSNNFSGTGLITNEENSVVLRSPGNSERIRSFTCDVDTMFEAGVEPGQPQKTDDARKAAVAKLDACNGPDTWFPPSGVIASGSSITYTNVVRAISGAKKSVSLAPDMMAHPGLVSALISRAKKAKAQSQPFAIKLVLDASEEALGNPAFGECLADAAAQYGLDVQIRYWPGTPEIFQLMHHKFMIVDQDDPAGAALYNGSANYSAKALKWSFENVTRYAGAPYRPVVDAFTARFGAMFAEGKTKARLAAEDHITAPACSLDLGSL